MINIKDIFFIPKKIIRDERGSVCHMLRSDDSYFDGKFGEIYFSTIRHHVIKGWKCHKRMMQRFSVPMGEVKFAFFDNRESSPTKGNIQEITLGQNNYGLLLVPPLIWYSFCGKVPGESLIANCSSLPHQADEVEIQPIFDSNFIPYQWS